MKDYRCDQTGQPIAGAIVKVILQPPGNGYAMDATDNQRMAAIYEKDFVSLQAAADYIKAHCRDL